MPTSVAARVSGVGVLLLFISACAAKAPPPLPAALAYPDFMFPVVPAPLQAVGSEAVDRAWRYLQNKDFANADREFSAALKRTPALYPAWAGTGYVALAQGDEDEALLAFD